MEERCLTFDIASLLKTPDIAETHSFLIEGSEIGNDFSDVTVNMRLKNTAGVVTVKADISGKCTAVCDRCLEDAVIDLTAHIDTTVTLDGSKDDSVVIENGRIDLVKTAYDALSLELPMIVLCKEDCRGLCSRCGANLNHGDCGCKED